mmetsp:Transcript_23128/g.74891  ORF Transcript_23128/g.74891 Transcript_23128/m.74891 type:complete len:211 (-) Transcript_23128:1905-2537(-)
MCEAQRRSCAASSRHAASCSKCQSDAQWLISSRMTVWASGAYDGIWRRHAGSASSSRSAPSTARSSSSECGDRLHEPSVRSSAPSAPKWTANGRSAGAEHRRVSSAVASAARGMLEWWVASCRQACSRACRLADSRRSTRARCARCSTTTHRLGRRRKAAMRSARARRVARRRRAAACTTIAPRRIARCARLPAVARTVAWSREADIRAS